MEFWLRIRVLPAGASSLVCFSSERVRKEDKFLMAGLVPPPERASQRPSRANPGILSRRPAQASLINHGCHAIWPRFEAVGLGVVAGRAGP